MKWNKIFHFIGKSRTRALRNKIYMQLRYFSNKIYKKCKKIHIKNVYIFLFFFIFIISKIPELHINFIPKSSSA